jgi:hypothetical protein
MESTAQYWRQVWETLERSWQPICQQRKSASPRSGPAVPRKGIFGASMRTFHIALRVVSPMPAAPRRPTMLSYRDDPANDGD